SGSTISPAASRPRHDGCRRPRRERAVSGFWERVRRLRREALGMNRRNLAFLVPYNPRPLFAIVDHKPSAKRRLLAAGIPVPATYATLALQWDLRRLAEILAPYRDFVLKPARGSGGGGVL